MMDKIKELYGELLGKGEKPDTAVMNYKTYQKLIHTMGGSKTFICPPGIYLSSREELSVEIYDSLADDEIIVCERDSFDWNTLMRE
jgi:hypothetical protein